MAYARQQHVCIHPFHIPNPKVKKETTTLAHEIRLLNWWSDIEGALGPSDAEICGDHKHSRKQLESVFIIRGCFF